MKVLWVIGILFLGFSLVLSKPQEDGVDTTSSSDEDEVTTTIAPIEIDATSTNGPPAEDEVTSTTGPATEDEVTSTSGPIEEEATSTSVPTEDEVTSTSSPIIEEEVTSTSAPAEEEVTSTSVPSEDEASSTSAPSEDENTSSSDPTEEEPAKPNTVGKDLTAIMDGWFETYDNRLRPNIGEGPVQINISMYILDFIEFDHIKDEFTIQLYLRQSWLDERLTYEAPDGVDLIMLDGENSKKLWLPDTFFASERRSKWHDVTTGNEFTRVSPEGHVLRSIRVTVTSNCDIDLKFFPFDINSCTFELESYAHQKKDYHYNWKENSEGITALSAGSNTGHMEVLGLKGSEFDITFSSGSYSRLAAELVFKRPSGRYIRDVFIPTAVITLLTFTTLSVGSPQLRLLLSFVGLLGILLVRIVSTDLIPTTSNSEPTYLHFYLYVAYTMVVATILVNFLAYHIEKRNRGPSSTGKPNDVEVAQELAATAETPVFANRTLEIIYTVCDLMNFILPVLYIAFLILYWLSMSIATYYDLPDDFISLENN